MASSPDRDFDVSQPALVLLFGNTNKRHRLLDRAVIVVGRARGCDLGLDAPDISSIHCVVTRGPGGFHLRDCQSRAGTKLNGNNIQETPLRDGDVIQLGPFSFRAQIPSGAIVRPAATVNSQFEHVLRSRRNLARIALRQRKALRLQGLLELNTGGNSKKDQLSKQLATLKTRVKDYDQRVRALEDAERELAKERETINQDNAAFRLLVDEAEQDLAKRRHALEEEMNNKHGAQIQQQQQRQRELDALTKQLQYREQQLQGKLAPVEAQQRQTQGLRDDLTKREGELATKVEDFERQQKEFSMVRDQFSHAQASILQRVGQQKSALAQAEESLRQQRQELDDLLADLQEGRVVADGSADSVLQELRAENEQLKQLLSLRQESPELGEVKLLELQLDNERLNKLLAEVQENAGGPAPAASADQAVQIEELQRQLAEREALLQDQEHPKDVDSYEAELNQFRRQLEADRKKLTSEVEQLRARNKELDDATREMELEMSRERAEMARERQRLDRLRDEIKLEAERISRDSGLRDRLAAPMKNLRDQINQRH